MKPPNIVNLQPEAYRIVEVKSKVGKDTPLEGYTSCFLIAGNFSYLDYEFVFMEMMYVYYEDAYMYKDAAILDLSFNKIAAEKYLKKFYPRGLKVMCNLNPHGSIERTATKAFELEHYEMLHLNLI